MKKMMLFLVIIPLCLISFQCGQSPTSPLVKVGLITEIIDLDLEITDLEEEAELDEEQSEKAAKFEKALGLLNRIIRYANKLVSDLDEENKEDLSNYLVEIKKLRNKARRLANKEKFGKAFTTLREGRIKVVGLIELITGAEYSVKKQKKYYNKLQRRQINVLEKIEQAKSELGNSDSPPQELLDLLDKAINNFETASIALDKWRLDKANKYFLRAKRKAKKILKTLNPSLNEDL
jgi:flagellin-specific chaperone FliS